MGILHIVLLLQCLRIVKSLSTWRKLYIRLFATLLWLGVAVSFVSGIGAMVAQFLQVRLDPKRASSGVPVVNWSAVFVSVSLCMSAFIDLLLASKMGFQLSQSKSSFSGSTHIVKGLTLVPQRNGAFLAW
jgi:hypothetical protein